jgi:hypothetical protein
MSVSPSISSLLVAANSNNNKEEEEEQFQKLEKAALQATTNLRK